MKNVFLKKTHPKNCKNSLVAGAWPPTIRNGLVTLDRQNYRPSPTTEEVDAWSGDPCAPHALLQR